MITIKCTNGFEFQYIGRIEISVDSLMLYIKATTYNTNTEALYTWDRLSHDWYWLDDIVSIIGSDGEKDRHPDETHLFSE